MKTLPYFLSLACIGLIASCNNDFINLKPITNAIPSTFFKTPGDFKLAVNAVYNGLQPTNTYGRFYYILMEARSDNTDMNDISASSGEYSQIDLFGETSTNSAIAAAYTGSYSIISNANLLLDRLKGTTILSPALRKQYAGEALFLRGLTYFNLVRLFGGVPMPLHAYNLPTEANTEKRQTVAAMYAQIENDLIAAADSLNGITYGLSDLGRATADAANSTLGKVYLREQKWTNAIAVLNKISGRSLVQNYASLYDLSQVNTAFAAEIIFAVRYEKGIVPSIGNNYYTQMTVGTDNHPGTDLVTNAYEANDLRKAISINAKGYVNKFSDPPGSTGDSGNNFLILRYADVLLMIAEATNELAYNSSSTGVAFTNINLVRARAGLPALTSTTTPDQTTFRDAIFRERRVELAFENDRWFDLCRYVNGLSILQKYLTGRGLNAGSIGSNRFVFPIPAAEISVHSDPINFPQNPGY